MSVSVNRAVAGSDPTTGQGTAGSVVQAGVNVLVAGGVTAGSGGSQSADFSVASNSMYEIFFDLGLGVN